MRRTISIALAFIGLLVGAGFATGQEVIQYFISFGPIGLGGALLSGVIFSVAGAVIFGLGSYFLADEHNMVFRNVSHPLMSRFLDAAVTLTLFAIGFVMIAGAGANLNQQFGWPVWVGSIVMTVLVMATGLLDVGKVSSIISGITPLLVLAVVGVFVYTLFNIPDDFSAATAAAQAQDSPVRPWWLSAVNYNGLALMLGASMSLVIGGNYTDPRTAVRGGLWGGLSYTILLLMAAFALYTNAESVASSSVPMLDLFDSISPILSMIMVWIIYGMIYNTCIGMFYALGRRLTAHHSNRYVPVFLIVTLLGFGISFIGFDVLMTYVYPVLGYIGIVLVVALLFWWFKHRGTIREEMERRKRIFELTYNRAHPEEDFSREEAHELKDIISESRVEDSKLKAAVEEEVYDELEADKEIDFERPDDDNDPNFATDEAAQEKQAGK